MICFSNKSGYILIALCVSTLSWWRSNDLSLHSARLLHWIWSWRQMRTCWFTVSPLGMNLWRTKSLRSKIQQTYLLSSILTGAPSYIRMILQYSTACSVTLFQNDTERFTHHLMWWPGQKCPDHPLSSPACHYKNLLFAASSLPIKSWVTVWRVSVEFPIHPARWFTPISNLGWVRPLSLAQSICNDSAQAGLFCQWLHLSSLWKGVPT